MIATSLEQAVGAGHLVARLAGDEFAVALAASKGGSPKSSFWGNGCFGR
jgi:GGDEF domain-containing protein